MRYRVQFRLTHDGVYYFTEWFDTLGEARAFALRAEQSLLRVDQILDENDEVVL